MGDCGRPNCYFSSSLMSYHPLRDDEVAAAMELAFREFKLVVEPGGAVGLACVLNERLPVKGRTVCVVCSGGNVDGEVFRAALATAARPRSG